MLAKLWTITYKWTDNTWQGEGEGELVTQITPDPIWGLIPTIIRLQLWIPRKRLSVDQSLH